MPTSARSPSPAPPLSLRSQTANTAEMYDSSNILRLDAFKAANLVIENEWHIVICELCGYGLKPKVIYQHVQGHSRRRLLPKDVDLENLLKSNKISTIPMRPLDPIRPIGCIPVVDGFKCVVPGCSYATRSTESGRTNHSAKVHKDLAPKDRHFTGCKVQQVIARVYWAVDTRQATLQDHGDDVIALLNSIETSDKNDAEVQIPLSENRRLMTPLLSAFQWGDIIDSLESTHDAARLGDSSLGEADSEYWSRLRSLNQKYFGCIRPQVPQLDATIRCWINTPEG